MPTFLALDTSTSACSVALSTATGEVYERFIVAAQQHTRQLLPMVDSLLSEHHLFLSDIDALVCSHGPGSFTGLRIGLSVVQGLAFSQQLPVILGSSLQLLAISAERELVLDENSIIMPTLDARMNDVYWGLYQGRAQNWEPLVFDRVEKADKLLENPDINAWREKIVGIGDGWACLGPTNITVVEDIYPHAADLFPLAHKQWQQGNTVNAVQVQPNYVRDKIHWKKRQRIRRE